MGKKRDYLAEVKRIHGSDLCDSTLGGDVPDLTQAEAKEILEQDENEQADRDKKAKKEFLDYLIARGFRIVEGPYSADPDVIHPLFTLSDLGMGFAGLEGQVGYWYRPKPEDTSRELTERVLVMVGGIKCFQPSQMYPIPIYAEGARYVAVARSLPQVLEEERRKLVG